MGRDSTITQDQVSAAAAAMTAEGVKPTARSVRDRLGSGSMGTVNKMLQQWRSSQAEQFAAAMTLPPAIQNAILGFASQEISNAKSALEDELAEQRREMADMALENERQAAALEERAQETAALASEKAAAEGKADQLFAELRLSREEAQKERQAAAQARAELDKAVLRLEAVPKLEDEVKSFRANLDKERASRIAFEQEAAVAKAQKADLEQRLLEAKELSARNADLLMKADERASKIADNLSGSRVANEVLKARIDGLARELGEEKTESGRLANEATAAREEAAELRGHLSAKNER